MATLEDLIAHVRSQSLVEFSDLADQHLIATINRGYLELAAATEWLWTVRSVSGHADPSLALPGDFGTLRRVVTGRGGARWTVRPAGGGLYEIVTSEPTDLEVEYHAVPDLLGQSQDVPILPRPYHFILAEYALWKLLERDELYERAAQHRTEYWSLYSQLRSFDDEVADTSELWAVGERPSDGGVRWL